MDRQNRQKLKEQLTGGVNVLILLTIALIYTVTGTRLGDDAVSALGSSRTVYAGKANGFAAISCMVSWDAEALPELLDVLLERDVRITFFVSGKWAKTHASLLRRMAEEGHEIGTCGYAPLLDGGVQTVTRDVEAACGVIREVTGAPVRYYCSGRRNRDISARAAEKLELIHVSASADLLSARDDAKDLVERACQRGFDGSILMIQPTDTALEALPGILDALAQKGLPVSTVGKLLKGNERYDNRQNAA